MSWLLLSKEETVDDGTLSVVFGLLEGYGFDLESFKFQYKYDSCKSDGNGALTTTTVGPVSTSTVVATTLGALGSQIATTTGPVSTSTVATYFRDFRVSNYHDNS